MFIVIMKKKTHKGQCHSLPWAFKLYAEELGAKAFLTHAPRHCFIMYQDEDNLFPEDWVNVEVTAQQYQPTRSIKEHFAISDSAVLAGTYLVPITDIQSAACQLADLALGYYHKYGRYDEFTLKCVEMSLRYYPMNPTAIIIRGNTLDTLLQQYLARNGNRKDAYTSEIDALTIQCLRDLRATHWTQDTEELRQRWQQSPEEAERIRENVHSIK